MKSNPSLLQPVVPILAAVLGLLFAVSPRAIASAQDHVDDALVISQKWIGEIDAGQYDESYSSGSGAMHDKVPQDRWAEVLKTLRAPWGPVVTRHQLSHVYKPNGFEGSEGEFLIVTYDTSFKKMDGVTEVVVLRWEDGKWRGAGYNAGKKASPDSAPLPNPASNTQVQTQEHVKPVAQ